MHCTEVMIAGQHILYDAELITKISPQWFEAEYWVQQSSLIGRASGRGEVFFFKNNGREFVLRHYQRGGMIGPLLQDRYFRLGLRRSRAWREWNLLADLVRLGLPVPRPVAARVCNTGMMYTADLVTMKIANSVTLSARLEKSAIEESRWRFIGATVRQFHNVGADHSDLNAHNILLSNDEVYLIDFDKSRLREPQKAWQLNNIKRLRRSLNKLASAQAIFYGEAEWQAFLAGYQTV